MSDDLARLGLQVDSTPVVKATGDMDKMTASAGKLEDATDSLAVSSRSATAALRDAGAVSATTNRATDDLRASIASGSAVTSAQIQAVGGWAAAQKIIQEANAATTRSEQIKATTVIGAEQAIAAATVESAAIQAAANDHVTGSSVKIRETLVLLREASVGNFTRMAGSASILIQAFGLLNAVLIPLAVAGAVVGAVFLTATQQINSGAKGTGDLTRGLGLTADQLDRVKDRTVSFGDTFKATFQVLGRDILSALGGDDTMSAIRDAWNSTVEFIEGLVAGLVGTVIGSVRVIMEAWKAMPTALGGQGTTAGIDFGRAFQSGLDSAKKGLDKFYSDVAAQARKNRISTIMDEAGKAPGSTGDHQIDSAQKQLQAAQNQLQSQTALNAAVMDGSMSFAEMTKQEKLDGEMKQIVAQRDADLIKNTVKSRQEAEALTAIIAKLGPVYSALYDQQMQAKQIAANDNLSQQNLILEKQIELAGKAADQREFEIAQYREILKLKQEGIDPSSALGQASLSTVGDNSRRSQAASRSLLSNGVVDSGTSLGTSAAKATLASDPDAYITRQKSAYDEIDKLRQQDVLSETQAVQAKARVDAEIQASRLSAASDFFGNLASLSTSSSRTLQGIGKAAAMTQAGIDGVLAVQKALAAYPPPINFIMAAGVGVAAAANVAKIAGFEQGGVNIQRVGGGPSDTLLTLTAPGESIINRQATAKNPNTLAAMNAGASFDGAAGGKGMQIQVIHDGSTGIQVQQMSEGKVRIIARQVVAEAAPDIAGSAVKEAKRQSPNWVADANKNPRRRASIG